MEFCPKLSILFGDLQTECVKMYIFAHTNSKKKPKSHNDEESQITFGKLANSWII